MDNQDKIKAIIDRIAERKHTDDDLSQLCELLSASDSERLIQFGKNIVGRIEGQKIHIGDRIYYSWNDEALSALVRMIQFAKRPQAEQQLLKRVGTRIDERLKELPDNVKLINLNKEWQQKQVQHPEDIDLNSRYQGTIGENNNIFNIFKDDANEQLLILGEPGAGKTTTMLELAKASIDRAEQQSDSPIPVLLKLSSWKKEQITMIDWLVEALIKEYPCGIKKKVVKKLLIGHKLLLMLDGLDELEENSRKNCVEAINNLLKPGERFHKKQKGRWSPSCIVICSRRQEYEILYETLEFKLQLNRAICLKALSDAQIKKYLADRQREEFWQTLQGQDSNKLQDVLQRPLFLRIVCDAMQEISIDELNNFTSLEERQLYLSRAYIRWCLLKKSEDSKREKWCLLKESEDSKREKKIRLLIWLAQQLQNHGQTEFFIESMQPSWLPPGTLKWYVLLVALSIILIFLLLLMGGIYIDYIDSNFNSLNIVWYSIFIIGSLVTAVSASLHQKINIFEDNIVNYTFGNYNINLTNFGQTFVFVMLFAVGLLIFLSLSTIPHVVKLICIILFCGLLMGGIARLNGHELQQKNFPNQGIWNSAINAACVAILIAVTAATGLSIKFPFKLFILQFLSSLLMIGLPAGLICALLCGGLTCIQHFILRLILFCNGHPWNYAKFLDNAVKLKLLRRVGGRYEFIHSLLKECFAILPDII